MPPIPQESTTPSSRIILLLPFLPPISSGLSPVRLSLRRDAGLLLLPWPFQLLQQPLVCSALELVHWLHSLRQGPMTASTCFSWLIWESFQLVVCCIIGCCCNIFICFYSVTLSWCISISAGQVPTVGLQDDVLLVHVTLAPLPLISKPQASLLIEASFATVELGLLVPLSFSLLPSQVGWVTLRQLSYLKMEAYDDEEREVTGPYLFQICTSSQVRS